MVAHPRLSGFGSSDKGLQRPPSSSSQTSNLPLLSVWKNQRRKLMFCQCANAKPVQSSKPKYPKLDLCCMDARLRATRNLHPSKLKKTNLKQPSTASEEETSTEGTDKTSSQSEELREPPQKPALHQCSRPKIHSQSGPGLESNTPQQCTQTANKLRH